MGSLKFYYTLKNGNLEIEAINEYTIASGVTRNDKDNLIRVKGYRSPLGNTYQHYNFSLILSEILKK
jgi:hypothetical protein